jgi:NodT family efflux transporter outer membrane factor (OMF) lipoprotein
MKHYLGIILALAMCTVISCSIFKPEKRSEPAGSLPVAFSVDSEGPDLPGRWWETFENPELNGLVEQALSGNFSLQEAWARLRQVQALAIQSGAPLYPDLSFTTNAARTRQRFYSESTDGGITQTVKNFSLGFMSSYELDLWGRIHSEQQAALMEASATREDLNATAMTLAAEVAEHWLNILSQRMQKRLLEAQLKTNLTYLELVELRFRKSMASALDVYQQRQIVEQVRTKIPAVEAREALLMHSLALLLGKPPLASIPIKGQRLPAPAKMPATGLPADLLAARPDVRAAGFRLLGADWQVASARANRLPALKLTAEAGYDAGELDLIFDSWLLGLAANLTAPLFDGNWRAAEVDRAHAVTDERLSAYRRTVITAIKEVEDALVSEDKQRLHILALDRQIIAAQRALDEAGERYRKGMNDYLPVLTQLLTVQGLERDMIQQQTELLIYRISLYRALGGAWVNDLNDQGVLNAQGNQVNAKNNR